jgi:Rps23 Pro-64 3,4-dihydroxylase Tpa1-like proline 4-hydroxylase
MASSTYECSYVIIDNFLTPQDHHFVWCYIQQERMEFVHRNKWVKAFRLTDGQPLWGPPYLSNPYEKDQENPVYPTGKAIDIVIKAVMDQAKLHENLLGKKGKDWAYFFARAYIYPKESGLSWHRDQENYVKGAFVYYAHPYWDSQWGGEFLFASPSTKNATFPKTLTYEGQQTFLGSHMENTHETNILMEEGVGTYILPKPNRLILMAGGILHCIKKVDCAAGNKVRASIQGFFQDPAGLVRD